MCWQRRASSANQRPASGDSAGSEPLRRRWRQTCTNRSSSGWLETGGGGVRREAGKERASVPFRLGVIEESELEGRGLPEGRDEKRPAWAPGRMTHGLRVGPLERHCGRPRYPWHTLPLSKNSTGNVLRKAQLWPARQWLRRERGRRGRGGSARSCAAPTGSRLVTTTSRTRPRASADCQIFHEASSVDGVRTMARRRTSKKLLFKFFSLEAIGKNFGWVIGYCSR